MVGVKYDSEVPRTGVSICPPNAQPALPTATELTDLSETSCKFNFNGATPFAESCTFPSPSLLSPTPLCFSPMLSQNRLSLCLVLSLSAESPWIYQGKLGNTDSDRGNVDQVTSHALTCPLFQCSIFHKPQVENLSVWLPLSFVSFVYSSTQSKRWD